jgi:hypothetical protein
MNALNPARTGSLVLSGSGRPAPDPAAGAGKSAGAARASGVVVRFAPPADWQQPTLSARLERAFAGRFAELPAATRDGVLIAAADPVDDLAEILAAASQFSGSPIGPGAFGPAADVGLLSIHDGRLHFRHPLVRSGVLQSETLTRRQAAHAALAGVLADQPYRRTWHRAQSIVGPDDQIAGELEASVVVVLGRGAVMSAIAGLQRSAQLTSSPARRGLRLLMAAEHAFGLGRADLVDQLVTAAARLDLSELDYARMQWLQEIFNDGVPGDATRGLRAVRDRPPVGPGRRPGSRAEPAARRRAAVLVGGHRPGRARPGGRGHPGAHRCHR